MDEPEEEIEIDTEALRNQLESNLNRINSILQEYKNSPFLSTEYREKLFHELLERYRQAIIDIKRIRPLIHPPHFRLADIARIRNRINNFEANRHRIEESLDVQRNILEKDKILLRKIGPFYDQIYPYLISVHDDIYEIQAKLFDLGYMRPLLRNEFEETDLTLQDTLKFYRAYLNILYELGEIESLLAQNPQASDYFAGKLVNIRKRIEMIRRIIYDNLPAISTKKYIFPKSPKKK
jgi:tetratricopeptide (TPR) repeat protein